MVSIAGTSLTVGAVASLVTEFLKRRGFLLSPSVIRIVVALICILIHAGVSLVSSDALGVETLLSAFLSYVSAVTVHDHALK